MLRNDLKILVVDDEENMLELLSGFLRSFGVERVAACRSPDEAFREIPRFKPDVIISDLMMKPVDGFEFVRRLRKDSSLSCGDTPVIMLTGCAQESEVIAAKKAGATAFLKKPVAPKLLAQRIDMVMSAASQASESSTNPAE